MLINPLTAVAPTILPANDVEDDEHMKWGGVEFHEINDNEHKWYKKLGHIQYQDTWYNMYIYTVKTVTCLHN